MAVDLWFREDVARILLATYETMRASTHAVGWEPLGPGAHVASERIAPYQQGFVDAVRAIALAFGVTEPAAPMLPRQGFSRPASERYALRNVE